MVLVLSIRIRPKVAVFDTKVNGRACNSACGYRRIAQSLRFLWQFDPDHGLRPRGVTTCSVLPAANRPYMTQEQIQDAVLSAL